MPQNTFYKFASKKNDASSIRSLNPQMQADCNLSNQQGNLILLLWITLRSCGWKPQILNAKPQRTHFLSQPYTDRQKHWFLQILKADWKKYLLVQVPQCLPIPSSKIMQMPMEQTLKDYYQMCLQNPSSLFRARNALNESWNTKSRIIPKHGTSLYCSHLSFHIQNSLFTHHSYERTRSSHFYNCFALIPEYAKYNLIFYLPQRSHTEKKEITTEGALLLREKNYFYAQECIKHTATPSTADFMRQQCDYKWQSKKLSIFMRYK